VRWVNPQSLSPQNHLAGHGMLPIGSVGMVISKPRKDSAARQALTLFTIISHASIGPERG
jgi:hypothetical protein